MRIPGKAALKVLQGNPGKQTQAYRLKRCPCEHGDDLEGSSQAGATPGNPNESEPGVNRTAIILPPALAVMYRRSGTFLFN
jgi:hypothetical protein